MDIKIGDKFINDEGVIITVTVISDVKTVAETVIINTSEKLDPDMVVYIVTYLHPDNDKLAFRLMSSNSILTDYAKIVESKEEADEVLKKLDSTTIDN